MALSAMTIGFGVKCRPVTFTVSVNDNSVGLVGVVSIHLPTDDGKQTGCLSRWERSPRKTFPNALHMSTTLPLSRQNFPFGRNNVPAIGALNEAALAPWTSTPAVLSPPGMLL